MANIKLEYGSAATVTITLGSLASDTTFLSGRESTEVDNSSTKYLDFLLTGEIMTGTTPTADREIRVYVVGSQDDSNFPDVFDGVDSAETVTNDGVRDGVCRLAASLIVTATSNVAYPFGPISVAGLFGGTLPKKFVVFVVHNTAVNLNSTNGNHLVFVTPVYETIT